MRPVLVLALLSLGILAACGFTPQPASTVTPSSPPLPAALRDLEPGGGEPAAAVTARSPHTAQLGGTYAFALEHCGLMSPIDFDRSLWDVVGAEDGSGGELTDDQVGELVNQTSGRITLIAPDVARFQTPRGAVVTLVRHDGPKRYRLCH